MYRLFYFLLIIFIPAIFSWWLFVPMAILLVYLAKLPYEMIVAGAVLDSVYYFGDSLLLKNCLVIFSSLLIIGALFLNDKIHWRKII